jgi:hypothetical protein
MNRRAGPPRRLTCGWCQGSLAAAVRRDAVFCSKSCRQAAHRAKIGRAHQVSRVDRAMRFAYADPPYPGTALKYYRDHPDFAGEVDHASLLEQLATYDGWALSTSAAALPDVLALCVARVLPVRVAVWVKAPRPHATARVLNVWEPVVFAGGRTRRADPRDASVLDALVGVVPRRRPTLPSYVIGAKPPIFCEWVFKLLGATAGDQLDDLFPGSGMVRRSWLWYQGVDPSRVPDGSTDPSRADPLKLFSRAVAPDVAPAGERDGSPLQARHV